MKKLTLTIAIILCLGINTFADPNGGGLFGRGSTPEGYFNGYDRDGISPLLPALPAHDQQGSQDADTPLGSGIAVLSVLGAAYLAGKRCKEK